MLPAPIHSLEHGPSGQNGWKQIKLFALWKPFSQLFTSTQLLVAYPAARPSPPPLLPSSLGEKGKFLSSKTIVEYHTFFTFFFVTIAYKPQATFPTERLKRTLLYIQILAKHLHGFQIISEKVWNWLLNYLILSLEDQLYTSIPYTYMLTSKDFGSHIS